MRARSSTAHECRENELCRARTSSFRATTLCVCTILLLFSGHKMNKWRSAVHSYSVHTAQMAHEHERARSIVRDKQWLFQWIQCKRLFLLFRYFPTHFYIWLPVSFLLHLYIVRKTIMTMRWWMPFEITGYIISLQLTICMTQIITAHWSSFAPLRLRFYWVVFLLFISEVRLEKCAQLFLI